MLTSARRQYDQQQRIVALALREARRNRRRGEAAASRSVLTYQAAAVGLALASIPDTLEEQGIATTAVAAVNAAALLTPGRTVVDLVSKTATDAAFDRLVGSLVQDAGRTATAVDATTRPAVTSHIRSLSPPSCSRCTILAGRIYRYSQDFARHPQCDCLMTLTTEAAGRDLVTDPKKAFEDGQVRGLSKADAESVRMGADMNQIVNVRRKKAGLTVGGSVLKRGRRMTPNGIFRVTADRAERLTLLRRHGYLI